MIRCDGLPEQFIEVIELCDSEKAETSRDQPEDDEAAAEEELLLGDGPESEWGEDLSDKVDRLLYSAEEDKEMEIDDIFAEGQEKNLKFPAEVSKDGWNQIPSCESGTSAVMEPPFKERGEPPSANKTSGPAKDLAPNPEANERRPPRDDNCLIPVAQIVPDILRQWSIRWVFSALTVKRIKQLKRDIYVEKPRLSVAAKAKQSVWSMKKGDVKQ